MGLKDPFEEDKLLSDFSKRALFVFVEVVRDCLPDNARERLPVTGFGSLVCDFVQFLPLFGSEADSDILYILPLHRVFHCISGCFISVSVYQWFITDAMLQRLCVSLCNVRYDPRRTAHNKCQ